MDVHISDSFKEMTTKAIIAIAMFILVYLLLIVLSIGLMILCVTGGIALIIAKPMAITIIAGIGMASLGLFILIFLFKFLFKRHTKDVRQFTEITHKSEPLLIEFIGDIVREVETDFPNKIYISADVNACVFYDSSFWSMFFPVKKNLQIGLGLVNSVTEDEFKAIIAHEFGHFSQRSMKVGSYVYNVNQVIHNMLFDNEAFDALMYKWAGMHGAFSVFVVIAMKIIKGIQWILRQMYDVVNVRYMALSREMEFHADAVAAHIAGYIPLKESLLRLNLANYSYNSVLEFYSGKIQENIKSKNVFKEHSFVMNFTAQRNEIPLKNGFPYLTKTDVNKYNKSKITLFAQWESHPSTEDRISALEKLEIVKDSAGNRPAIHLFTNPERTQEQVTEMLFSQVTYEGAPTNYELNTFENQYAESVYKYSFNSIYNGYYDHKIPIAFDMESFIASQPEILLQECFTNDKVEMIYELIALENDSNIVKSILDDESTVKTFDYDGRKYSLSDSPKLLVKLNNLIEELTRKIAAHDIVIYNNFYILAEKIGKQDELKHAYMAFFLHDKVMDKKGEWYLSLRKSLEFLNTVTSFTEIEDNFSKIAVQEIELKDDIRKLMANERLRGEITPKMEENLKKYCENELVYFSNQAYNNDELAIFMTALGEYAHLNSRNYFLTKLNLLNFQISMMDNQSNM